MSETEIITNANIISLRAQIDALIFTLDESRKNIYERRLIDSMAKIYESYEGHIDAKDFDKIKILAEAMVFRN